MTIPDNDAHSESKRVKTDSSWLFDSMNQAANFTGTPLTLMKASKMAGCRAFKLGNRVDYLEFLKWYWAKDETENGLPDGFATWKEVLDSEKAKREAIKRQVDEKSVMPTDEAERQAAAACGFVDAELQRAENELPPVMAGLSAVECGKILHGFTEKLRAAAKAKFGEVGK